MKVRFKVMSEGGRAPVYAKHGDAGADLCAAHGGSVRPGFRAFIDTAVAIELPHGYEATVRPRSGLARKHGVVSSVGTIDSGYRGSIGVVLFNLGSSEFHFKAGDRIAQLVVSPVVSADFEQTEEISGSERGSDGFGSSGV